jgi:hypothetical protein
MFRMLYDEEINKFAAERGDKSEPDFVGEFGLGWRSTLLWQSDILIFDIYCTSPFFKTPPSLLLAATCNTHLCKKNRQCLCPESTSPHKTKVGLPMLRYGLHGSVKASISEGVKIAPLCLNISHQPMPNLRSRFWFCYALYLFLPIRPAPERSDRQARGERWRRRGIGLAREDSGN